MKKLKIIIIIGIIAILGIGIGYMYAPKRIKTANTFPMIVAIAAPRIPKAGKPAFPKINR